MIRLRLAASRALISAALALIPDRSGDAPAPRPTDRERILLAALSRARACARHLADAHAAGVTPSASVVATARGFDRVTVDLRE
jgi:hypothetical protein